MAAKNNGSNNGPGGQNVKAGGGSGKTAGNGSGPANTSTETGRPNTSTESESPRPVLVSVPLPGGETAEPEKKTRNRPTGLKYNKDKSKKSNPTIPTDVLVSSLYEGIFSVAAGRLGDHWKLSEDEADSLAGPTSNIIDNFLGSETLEKMGDGGALILALIVVVSGKVIQSFMLKQMKPKGGKQNATHNNTSGAPSGNSQPNGTPTPKQPGREQSASQNDSSPLKQLLDDVSLAAYG